MNHEHYDYWKDKGLEIRTCKNCKTSEAKSPVDGVWVCYFTYERVIRACDQLLETGFADCELCSKYWNEED